MFYNTDPVNGQFNRIWFPRSRSAMKDEVLPQIFGEIPIDCFWENMREEWRRVPVMVANEIMVLIPCKIALEDKDAPLGGVINHGVMNIGHGFTVHQIIRINTGHGDEISIDSFHGRLAIILVNPFDAWMPVKGLSQRLISLAAIDPYSEILKRLA